MSGANLDYFCALKDAKTLSEAAQKSNLSQQAFSSYLKRLEKELGLTLLVRGQNMHLTPAGERTMESALRIKSEYELLKRDLVELKQYEQQNFIIGLFEPLAQQFMEDEAFSNFFLRHSNATFEIVTGSSSDIVELIKERKAHLGITTLFNIEQTQKENPALVFYWLSTSKKYLVGRKALFEERFFRESKAGYALSEFASMPLVLPYATTVLNQKIRQYFRNARIQPKIIAEGRNDRMLSSFVLSGRAVGICHESELSVLRKRQDEDLAIFPLVQPCLNGKNVLVINRSVSQNEPIADLIETIKKQAFQS